MNSDRHPDVRLEQHGLLISAIPLSMNMPNGPSLDSDRGTEFSKVWLLLSLISHPQGDLMDVGFVSRLVTVTVNRARYTQRQGSGAGPQGEEYLHEICIPRVRTTFVSRHGRTLEVEYPVSPLAVRNEVKEVHLILMKLAASGLLMR